MKISSWTRKLSAALAAGGLTTGTVAYADITSTLTGVMPTVTNASVPTNHGSTAETTVTWPSDFDSSGFEDWDQYAAWDGRGDVYQIDDYAATIQFAPTASNIKISIDSFFLDEYAGGSNTSVAWSITGSSSGLLASGVWDDFNTANDPGDAGGRTQVLPAAVSGARGETLTVLFDQSASGGYVSYLAMDNLTFSSQVPEPGSAVLAWLGVGGLGAAAMRRKRK